MTQGWIKLYRQLLEWEWYKNPVVYRLFMHLLLKANHQRQKWQGIVINRGQLITGRIKISEETGLTQQQVRTGLNKLKSTNEITINSTNRFSLITIVNWDKYQGEEGPTTSKTTSNLPNKQPTDNQQITTNKNVKNVKNVKNKYIDLFEEFWKKYPKKVGKGKARNKYIILLKKDKAIHPVILEAIDNQIKYRAYLKGKGEFVADWKHPTTWLNQECWDDDTTMPEEERLRQMTQEEINQKFKETMKHFN